MNDDLEPNYGACATHCCQYHGCKYGEDDCPVANGTIKREFNCGWCQEPGMVGDPEICRVQGERMPGPDYHDDDDLEDDDSGICSNAWSIGSDPEIYHNENGAYGPTQSYYAELEKIFRAKAAACLNDPKWYGMLVVHLVNGLRYNAALDVFRTCRWPDMTEYALRNFHVLVINALLEVGEVKFAKEVLDSVPENLRKHMCLIDASHHVGDLLEVITLGERIYPSNFPLSVRWKRPLAVPPIYEGNPLIAWYPARIQVDDEDGPQIVLGFKDESGDHTYVKNLEHVIWVGERRTNDVFCEVGSYEDGSVIVMSYSDSDITSKFDN